MENILGLRDFKRDYLDKHVQFTADPAKVSPLLYSDVPEAIAQRIGMSLFTDRKTQQQKLGAKKENKPTQLRRFYDELCLWAEKVAGKPESFQMHLPLVRMLKAKVAYAKGRGHVDADFEALMRHCIDQIDSPVKLHQCKTFFEAFMGFYKATRPKD
ncbi:MAG: type III-A CRISPR-associated protein Csm2 [Rhodocyclaceae bacterium]|nr:hypothetical protein [Bacteroidia bacterium]MCQ3925407.1 type III-A CRISPR-associated protein Csm2 [Rhodocyclaceae bacterium]